MNGEGLELLHWRTTLYPIIPSRFKNFRAQLNDWIIQGEKGEFYPCKLDIFEATYEPEELNALELGAEIRRSGQLNP